MGLLLSKDAAGTYCVEHVARMFATPGAVTAAMVRCAQTDGRQVQISFRQDPGSAGKMEAEHTAKALNGYNVRFAPATGNKEVRAKPVSTQCKAGTLANTVPDEPQ